jgi:hypothetical protein
MSAKNRYEAARTKFDQLEYNLLTGAEMADIFEYVEELEKALHQEGHIVEFNENGFGLEHPVSCRKAGLLNCPVWEVLDELPDTPVGYGRFPVALDDDGLLVLQIPPQCETVGISIEEKTT